MVRGVAGINHRLLARAFPACGLVLIALAFSWSHWTAPPRWIPDALFYEAQVQEIGGTPASVARREAFFGPLGASSSDLSGRLEGKRWVEYAAPFYRRRWVVPAMAAAVRPAAGTRALELVSLLGYVLSGLLVFALARRRFSVGISFAAGAFVLWFPSLRQWSAYPLTDSMGIAALALAFLTAAWAIQGRSIRLLAWAASVLLLSFTRDTAVIAVAGAVWLSLAQRSRRTAALALSGILAAAPAPLLFGAPLRATMAFTFSDNKIPADASWHYIFHEYGTFAGLMLKYDFPFSSNVILSVLLVTLVVLLAFKVRPSSTARKVRQVLLVALASVLAVVAVLVAPLQLASLPDPVPAGLLMLAALAPLFLPAHGDAFINLARGGALGAVGYLFLLPQSTDLRLALVLLVFSALGVARGIDLARHPSTASTAPLRRSRQTAPAAT
jgi:hypothetical protein